MITFTIETLTPCLREIGTGEIFDTEVIRLKRKSFLAKFNKHTGWYVNFHASQIFTRNGTHRFMIEGENTQKLMEVYNYEWTEEEL